jgi:formylmethanofuran dehydrogenase subunit E
MSCTHKTGRWEDVFQYTDWGGNDVFERQWLETSLMDDIDIHRMRCSRCGEIGYYSGRAKAHYEKGTSFPGIKGLE